ncbi:fungal-specific transcription factor domain-containing protein [Stachybotrys elegans]|uniref:Fungal-specific transcription factor domain-containing protein n=1 Tax=Stachybotrys elegans TaxID=80388 RepID=A0A8K0WLK0_9HYPO|nr:fungal-specific transcription factor domain-containing protein [Stachybotrys elegans]
MESANSGNQPLGAGRRRRLKVDIACEICRRRKVKCDGVRPACANCSKRPAFRGKCVYAPSPSERPAGSPSTQYAYATSESALVREPAQQRKSGVLQPPIVLSSVAPEQSLASPLPPAITQPSRSTQHFGDSSSSAFAEQIKAAIDSRSSGGAPHPKEPTATPLVDISLFPSLENDSIIDDLADGMEYELPTRMQADFLVHSYWSLVHPLFPVLSEPRFTHSYNAIFSGSTIDTNERVLVSTLNTVFALSVQLQESLDPKQRERLSGKYFQRAHVLLRVPVWETASIDLIQCLLLMGQYLQCTNKPHRTWMVVGSAVRIAQSLGLHVPENWANHSHEEAAALKRRVWLSCIIMDRMICIAHGRPAMISEDLSSTAIHTHRHTYSQTDEDNQLPYDEFVTRALELCEISHHAAQRYFSSSRRQNVNADGTGILDPSPTEDRLALILQMEGSLTRWEHSLPAHLKYGSGEHMRDDISTRQATVLRLRFLHSRVLLFRPILARCCLVTEPESPTDSSLTRYLIEQCASESVAAARNMISAIHKHQTHDNRMMPAWWYRVFYTYTAGMVLAVSTLRRDLFPRSATQTAWENALALLEAHEPLNGSVRLCKVALQRLMSRIEQTQSVPLLFDRTLLNNQGVMGGNHLDFLQDFSNHLDDFSMFSLDDISWLINEQF